MAVQPIQSMLDGAQMHNAMIARAQGPMMRELSPTGPQAMYDPGSSVVANVQPQREMQYASQQVQQNAEVMVGNGLGDSTLALQQVMNGPERAQHLNNVALGKAQAIGTNPALAQEAAQIMNLRSMA